MMMQFGLENSVKGFPNLMLVDPLGYLEFLSLMGSAMLLITDSGGIQEETTYLQIPCLTLRENTERPITVQLGTNQLCGNDLEVLQARALAIMEGNVKKGQLPELWDGKAAERIVKVVTSTSSLSCDP